jgi:DNA modification methylase
VSVVILRGDARHLPLPDESVDLVVTSPPYWGLRSYTDDGEHYDGQIGSEDTPGEFIAALVACTREWMRVLKPSGSMFVNLGDKYAGSQPHADHGTGASTLNGHGGAGTAKDQGIKFRRRADFGSVPVKSLLGMPWRYALGCVDDLGLILRAEIIWSKPNGLPESVTDRVRRSHEQVFHFTKQPRYFAAVDEIREDSTGYHRDRMAERGPRDSTTKARAMLDTCNPLGKLPGSVWEIPSQPLAVPASLGVDHFAAFPMELPRRIILGWSPSGICTECGEGRRPVTIEGGHVQAGHGGTEVGDARRQAWIPRPSKASTLRTIAPKAIAGYACACPQPDAPARPAVVLDPFGGTGTTALVADMLGRTGVTVDRSADYCRLARWRTSDPAERARALGVPKPPPVMTGQGSLFDQGEAAS